MSEYKKLENQPLKFVLAEFRFSPVWDIADFIPKIQGALRKTYPTPDVSSDQTVQLRSGSIAMTASDRWTFVSANKRSAIDINQDRLVCVTTEYPRFEGFSDSCTQAIETIVKIVDPGLILRIGLRYGDLILVSGDEKITDLVDSQLGVPSNIESLGPTIQHSTNTYLQTEVGVLVIRTLYGISDLTCLPDAQGLPIPITSDNTQSERMILDFDHFWDAKNESTNFEKEAILKKLAELHETSRNAFWNITTEYARNEKWA